MTYMLSKSQENLTESEQYPLGSVETPYDHLFTKLSPLKHSLATSNTEFQEQRRPSMDNRRSPSAYRDGAVGHYLHHQPEPSPNYHHHHPGMEIRPSRPNILDDGELTMPKSSPLPFPSNFKHEINTIPHSQEFSMGPSGDQGAGYHYDTRELNRYCREGSRSPSRRQTTKGSKPFPRKSKAGNKHYVTPSRASRGFKCTFHQSGSCSSDEKFDVPSKMRDHLIKEHCSFSPFQCNNCKKVFTRLSLLTRHRTPKNGNSDERVCPNEPCEPDAHFSMRQEVHSALWAIRLNQEEVDIATELIQKYNPVLEKKKRRAYGNYSHEPPASRTRTGFGSPNSQSDFYDGSGDSSRGDSPSQYGEYHTYRGETGHDILTERNSMSQSTAAHIPRDPRFRPPPSLPLPPPPPSQPAPIDHVSDRSEAPSGQAAGLLPAMTADIPVLGVRQYYSSSSSAAAAASASYHLPPVTSLPTSSSSSSSSSLEALHNTIGHDISSHRQYRPWPPVSVPVPQRAQEMFHHSSRTLGLSSRSQTVKDNYRSAPPYE